MSENNFQIAVLVSGNGSNLQAIIDACKSEQVPAQVALVISDQPQAFALERAKQAHIPSYVIERKNFASRQAFEEEMVQVLRKYQIKLVCMAGFMRLIGKTLLTAFPNRIINIHPSLLPAFPGLNAIAQALEAKVAKTGCTVHLVNEQMDSGPTLHQAEVEILPHDTIATLTERVHAAEHQLYPAVLGQIISQKIRLDEF